MPPTLFTFSWHVQHVQTSVPLAVSTYICYCFNLPPNFHSTPTVDGHKISFPPEPAQKFARTGLLFDFLDNVGCCCCRYPRTTTS
uniref:Putative secreted protein n=1 Tax=Anopheles triannulatus TaxID=58253 RepID=A0A2M4B260_9DIPT